MKKVMVLFTAIFLFTTAFAFAGGDQNQNRHDGTKGQGTTQQKRINK
jgi:hypothetical protein